MTDRISTPDHLRHALLDIEDRLARLDELLHLIAMAGEGLEPCHAAAIARGIQLAQDQSAEIRDVVKNAVIKANLGNGVRTT